MDHQEIRRTAICAIFSDRILTENLLLKGGNALEIGLGIISRGSYDLDFSIPGAFEDVDEVRRRIFASLETQFDRHGLRVIDQRFEVKPPDGVDDDTPWWGGYRASFKLLPYRRHEVLLGRPDKASIEALTVAGGQDRTFVIDISKHEFCGDRQAVDLDGCTIWLYTPAMLAIEKLRAICQQMPEYGQLKNKRPRVAESVVGSVPAEFDFYFNFTVREALKLQPLRIE